MTRPDLHPGDFSISFDLNVTSWGPSQMEILNQRARCGGGIWWDIRAVPAAVPPDRLLNFEFMHGAVPPVTYDSFQSTIPITTGASHHVVVRRTGGDGGGGYALTIDGVAAGGTAPSTVSYPAPESLDAPVTIGTGGCIGTDGTVPLSNATVMNVCVSW